MGSVQGKAYVTKGKGPKASSSKDLAEKGHLTFGGSGTSTGITGLAAVTKRGKKAR